MFHNVFKCVSKKGEKYCRKDTALQSITGLGPEPECVVTPQAQTQHRQSCSFVGKEDYSRCDHINVMCLLTHNLIFWMFKMITTGWLLGKLFIHFQQKHHNISK